MKKIVSIVGARPQFIKHAPIELYFKDKIIVVNIHTGQHFDKNMSQIFFDELKMGKPQYMLEAGGLTHGQQTGKMLAEIEQILEVEKPDAVLVYGDTNSTLAGALAAAKMHIPIIHVEAGLRSYNKEMPEEVNRVLTDHVSSILLCPTDIAVENLAKEGIVTNVFKTGDVMADMVRIAQESGFLKVETNERYIYATIHRPYNTDDVSRLSKVIDAMDSLPDKVIFARHPRTKKLMAKFGIKDESYKNITFIGPVSYFENLAYLSNAAMLITDSGGMQKEAYILKRKCVTIRKETEWVETLHDNWNTLVFHDLEKITEIYSLETQNHDSELYGIGNAAEEIYHIIERHTALLN